MGPGGAIPAVTGGATTAVATTPGAAARIVGGRAIPPAGAPDAVKQAILRANDLIGKPYRWGGGPPAWKAGGHDCSGARSPAPPRRGPPSRPPGSPRLPRPGG